ncbi:thioredoxin-like protein [Amylostereum chailletii]|nr:thioredoxin-like protein [Amylostereum chailletii]
MPRRRYLLPVVALVLLVLFFRSSHSFLSLPDILQDFHPLSPASISHTRRAQEIHGLLHFVVNKPDKILVPAGTIQGDEGALDPTRPIELRVYGEDGAQDGSEGEWRERIRALDRDTPLVVFSKTYCPYSKRAKDLLATYDLYPPPKIVEVDLRDDGDLIKAILARLTSHTTFPNIILKGESIGGSDTLLDLHTSRKLRRMFEKAGMQVRGDVQNKA